MSDIAAWIGALFSDALTAVSSPVASAGGAVLTTALSAVLKKRQEAARSILLDEIRYRKASPTTDDVDESVSILYRYWRAAQEGTGRLNLRLLATVYAGQVCDRAIVADDFLYYADLLASLRRNEIILLGTFLRNSTRPDGGPRARNEAMRSTREELVPAIFNTYEDCTAALGSLLRTGLISAGISQTTFDAQTNIEYEPTTLLRKFNELADIEGVVNREQASACANSKQST